jgi:hypothetical protein
VSWSREQCGSEQQSALDWCMALGRLAEAAPCGPQAARAFECAARTSARCAGAACCSANRECGNLDIAFDHCARGYCGGHSANPDCRWFGGDDVSPISFVSPKRPASPADPESELAAAVSAGVRKIDDTHYDVKSSLVEQILINPMAFAKGARLVPAVKDGQPEGFKLYVIRPASLYARIGLMNGDTIQSINGHRLDTADKALEIYTALRDAKRLEIGLSRRGRPLTITITITE